MTPGGTAVDPIGGPTAPSKDGIGFFELVEDRVGQHFARALVTAGAEVILDGLDLDPGSIDDLERLRDDLGADPVAPYDCDSVCADSWFHFPVTLVGVPAVASEPGTRRPQVLRPSPRERPVPHHTVVKVLVAETTVTDEDLPVDHGVSCPAHRTPDDRLDRVEHRPGGRQSAERVARHIGALADLERTDIGAPEAPGAATGCHLQSSPCRQGGGAVPEMGKQERLTDLPPQVARVVSC